jgi:hypothetical protein
LVLAYGYDINTWYIQTGQAVQVQFTNAGATLIKQLLITQILYNGINTVSLVFDEPVASVAAAADITNISLISEESVSTIQVNQMNLVLKLLPPQDKLSVKDMKSYMVSEWKLEKFNIDASEKFSKTFILEKGTVNVILMSPLLDSLVSVTDDMIEYDLLLDGIPISERNVVIDTCDYFNEVKKVFKNLGKTNGKYDYEVHNLYPEFNLGGDTKSIVSSVVSITDDKQILQVSIKNSTASSPKIGYLWKQVIKTIVL